ncbi:MAG: hypothetical protein KDB27_17970 [Planctomycetales bacterium]|nr:hypothetical protein [Planctomycetales bacterium]
MEDNSGGISGIVIRQTGGGAAPGDFNGNGILDSGDIEQLSVEVRAGTNTASFDLDNNGKVDAADRVVWVEGLKNTYFGDSNLDLSFNSSDFVVVFTAAKYEKGTPATWAEGDWNGDGVFSSADFVVAFSGAGYEAGPRPAQAVPEPAVPAALIAMVVCLMARRNRK